MAVFGATSTLNTLLRRVKRANFFFPRIDMFIGSSACHEMFCFMDSFSDYNQIRMFLNSLGIMALRILDKHTV